MRAFSVLAAVASCPLARSGAFGRWGADFWGQIGDGDAPAFDSEPTPVSVALPGAVTAADGGESHTCAVVAGSLYCWGYNMTGQLGDATTTSRATPGSVTAIPAS